MRPTDLSHRLPMLADQFAELTQHYQTNLPFDLPKAQTLQALYMVICAKTGQDTTPPPPTSPLPPITTLAKQGHDLHLPISLHRQPWDHARHMQWYADITAACRNSKG